MEENFKETGHQVFKDPNSRIYATIPGQTTIGPVLQVHITRFLDTSGIDERSKILGGYMPR